MPSSSALNTARNNLLANLQTLAATNPLAPETHQLTLLSLIADNAGTGGSGGGSAGTQYPEGDNTASATGTVLLFRRTDGTFKALQGDNSDRLKVYDSNTETILGRLPASLGAKPATQSFPVTLSSDGAFATGFGAAADAAASSDTASTGFISLFKRLLGKLPAALVGGRFSADAVVRTAASNPLQYNAIANSTGASIKASAGAIYSLSCLNLNASVRYLQLFNKASAPAANDVPIESFAVYGNGGQLVLGQDYFSLNGLDFTAGVSWGISTTAGFYTAATASETIFTSRYL